ncbi:MAG: hypothetical protein EOP43_01850 [Sphingobacteriaceae bacterium]|nr:MAG: hypothetical protein EOP43_01850 [Sphingobacteriaceae bacterium]
MKQIAIIILLATSCIVRNTYAQTYQNQISGVATQTKDYTDIKGSPYLSDDWAKGSVLLNNMQAYSNIEVKYNEYTDKLHFRGKNDETLNFSDKVKEFTITYTKETNLITEHYRSGYNNIPGIETDAYLQTLSEGKAQLLKKTLKKIQTNNEYGSISTNKSFVPSIRYYIINGEKASMIKKDKKSVFSALGNKQSELESYSKTNNIDFKKDADLINLITYYNGL